MAVVADHGSSVTAFTAAESRSNASQSDMSDRITWSPTFSPDTISTVVDRAAAELDLDARRLAVGLQLEQADGALLLTERRPADGRTSAQPLELDRCRRRSGRAARPSAARPSIVTSTVTVPFCTDGSMRTTLPATTPLRVSIEAGCPIWMSLACVSAIFSSALRREGSATRARLVPGATCWPTSTGHDLQHAGDAGADVQFVHLPLLQLHDRARLIDLGLLHGQPRLRRLGVALELLLGDGQARRQLVGVERRLLQRHVRDQTLVGQLLVDLDLQRGLLVVGLDAGRRSPPGRARRSGAARAGW